jgi:hypothetical protein
MEGRLTPGFPKVYTFILGAGGAAGAIARGEVPQRGVQPRECRTQVKQAPLGAADSLP